MGSKYQTHCKNGHELSGENLLNYGQRVCKTCSNSRAKKYAQTEYGRKMGKIRQQKYVENNHKKLLERGKLRRDRLTALVAELKSEPCIDCGSTYPFYVMDFDHVYGEKKMDISQMIASGYRIEAILDEISKCELVCANCHRIRTYERRYSDGRN